MVDKPRILVIYTSMSGHTEALARAIADGARGGQNIEVELKRARDVTPDDIGGASAIAFGSPSYFSYMSGELKSLFDNALPFKGKLEGKPAIAFGTGEGGQIKAVESIENILTYFGVQFVQKSDILSAGLATQGAPDDHALKMANQVGKKLSDAGIGYVCEKAKREQGIVIGEHTGR
ncbi:MAG TPA: NAD(P)H-dependent oxidoreductase [Methanocella sp.]|jgi:NAD(P)H dehydrogenase (quinone)